MPQDDNGFHIPDLPKFPTDGKEFFNILMGQIEPDLTLDHVDGLKEKYADETDEEHVTRMERYKAALNAYREKRDHYFDTFTQQVKKFTKDLSSEAEKTVRDVEHTRLEELEAMFAQ